MWLDRALCVDPGPDVGGGLPSVGASLLAKNVNDNACFLNERGA
ncbi:hypothetical protein C4J97_2199 [Pseudomonas orientalis]|nr:hypothetical protein C4J97_2199 [Pseudomonas orientalis]